MRAFFEDHDMQFEKDYLPFSPMPPSIKSCQASVSELIRAMEWNVTTHEPLLAWLASWSDHIDDIAEVEHFVIEENFGGGFIVIAYLPGGSYVGFSYHRPIANFYNFVKTGHVKTKEEKRARLLRDAMRKAVEYQCLRWEEANPKPCAGAVRDHAYPGTMSSLIARFLLETGGEIELRQGTRETKFMKVLKDSAVLKRWREFHEKRARLRWIDRGVNSAIGDRNPYDLGYVNLPEGTPIPSEKKGFGARLR